MPSACGSDVLERLEAASVTTEEPIRRKLLTFVVVGGGYSGVETAGQIWDLLRDVQRFYPRINPKEFRLVLVQSGTLFTAANRRRTWEVLRYRSSGAGGSKFV